MSEVNIYLFRTSDRDGHQVHYLEPVREEFGVTEVFPGEALAPSTSCQRGPYTNGTIERGRTGGTHPKNILQTFLVSQRLPLIPSSAWRDFRSVKNLNCHKGVEWAKVQAKLEADPEKLWSLNDMSTAIGVQFLTEEQYFELQKLGELDTKTSTWVKTPGDIRELGGALPCDRRHGRAFVRHNGARSYYAARGLHGWLKARVWRNASQPFGKP